MKLVIAPDSFKESLSARAVAEAIAAGWARVYPDAELLLCPMADGGEGTVDALLSATGGKLQQTRVSGPLGDPVEAHWGLLPDAQAIIEMAEASGLHRVEPGRRDVLAASSHGTGELIRAALDAGVRRIVLGLGGSATNDGGAGLLAALGVRFLDREGQELPLGGAALARLSQIDLTGLDTRLAQVEVMVAADVDNPLCGPRGASAVFGPQKGASPEQVAQLDEALGHYADVMAATLGEDLRDFPGVGAAGGLGFAARAVLRAGFRPGVELVAELSGLVEAMQGADLVITGEGRLDGQSLHGKTPVGVARLARTAGVPVIALAGSLGEGYQRLYAEGIGAAFSLAPGPLSLEQAMAEAGPELSARAADLARLWRIADDTRLSPVQ
ncbi:MAG TPA: glycerate kinase [Pseudomonas sp.]|nr:glycerate kinase [Pseudomonadales bacterium]HCA22743.1 glycerate kinase [Pseudomonas sp.]MBB52080.1 glycerate kinase [Pseudomonadales bacterium]MBB52390.1 glycerate kinase [Pseudomonadales bacterium]MBU31087.1 glycerate kinase [Pseudomonadales bacterium]|tara:strand:- start:10 stop:1164 length:1155 start_codon:yes stop_codon:yes gene_type:complete